MASDAAAAESSEDALVVKRLFAAMSNTSSYNVRAPDDYVVVFRWGSRLWGTHTKASDHDLVVVHCAPHGNTIGASPCAGIDVKAVGAERLLEAVAAENDVAYWLPLLLPPEAALYCDARKWAALKQRILKAAPQPNLDGMLATLHATLAADEARAAKNAQQQQATKARKIVLHSLRLCLAVSLVIKATTPTQSAPPPPPTAAASAAAASKAKKGAAAAAASAPPSYVVPLAEIHQVQEAVEAFMAEVEDDDLGEVYKKMRSIAAASATSR
jgi:hypothetical protein